MIISTQTDVLTRHYTYEETIRILKDAGYDAFDLSLFTMLNDDDMFNSADYPAVAKRLRAVADECGIVCNQAHAPFPSSKEDEVYNQTVFERIVRAMEIASVLGAKQIVVHPMQHLNYQENVQTLKEMNHEFYMALLPYCEKFHIRVALENMFHRDPRRQVLIDSTCSHPAEFREYLDALPSRYFTACLDLGHCGLVSQDAAHFIRELGHDRLTALHVHDNDFLQDQHTLPFQGHLNWDSITTALAQIRYSGEFTLEADNFLVRLPKEVMPEGARFMCRTARYLADEITRKIKEAGE